MYGSFIQPSKTKNHYSFNYYALSLKDGGFNYFFAAIISYKIEDGKVLKNKKNYLFTEKEALKHWWTSAYSHCSNNNIFRNKNDFNLPCLPPPFKK